MYAFSDNCAHISLGHVLLGATPKDAQTGTQQ
uniref:Uncharacterized protein n=1 Tax=viral metagenome TaxID=1070528 RepID=A0A6C0C2E9_9ZZZZ